MRDHGVKSMPIDVDPAIAVEMRKRFGVDVRFREVPQIQSDNVDVNESLR
jgi:hypothetical protein